MGKGAHQGVKRNTMGVATLKKTSWKEFFGILRPYFFPAAWSARLRAMLCFVALGLSKTANILAPFLIGEAIDRLSDEDRRYDAWVPVLYYVALKFSVSAFAELQRFSYLRVKEVAYREVAVSTFRHVHSLSMGWHLNKSTGAVLRSLDRGINSAATVVDMLFLRLVPSCIELVVLCILFITEYEAVEESAVMFSGFVLYLVCTYVMSEWRRRVRNRMHRRDNEANEKAVDSLTNFETVKAFSNEEFELERYAKSITAYQRANYQTQTSLVTMNVSQNFIIQLTGLGILLLAAKRVHDGESVSLFVVLNVFTLQVFAPLGFLGTVYTMVINAFTDMSNLSDLLREDPDVKDIPGAKPLLVDRQKGLSIEFENVTFAYPKSTIILQAKNAAADKKDANTRFSWKSFRRVPKTAGAGAGVGAGTGVHGAAEAKADAGTAQPSDVQVQEQESEEPRVVLKNISFTISAGTTTGIVGHTGSGKSTIGRVLFRFYDLMSGVVKLGGQDITKVQQHSLRREIGLVPQDTTLFNDTLYYNIQYGNVKATKEQVEAATESAQLSEFITKLPKGMETRVGERGLKLSGGERQRVSIARTLLKDPPVLVLDEATSALDSITETEVQKAINGALTGRTAVVIAHRLSTIMHADQILVMSDGEIIERGTHAELLALGGEYASMWEAQSRATDEAQAALDAGGVPAAEDREAQ